MDPERRNWIEKNIPKEENGYEIYFDNQGKMIEHTIACREILYSDRICYGKECICSCHAPYPSFTGKNPDPFIGGFTF